MELLPISFYSTYDTPTIARNLLGKTLVYESHRGRISGRIVETEAYLATHDPASHSARGQTRRNASMFGPPGTSYVYLSYGMHHCLNVVCQREGVGEAVLIRALEPLAGIALMRQNRGKRSDKELTNGPGKLCQALGIDLSLDGHSLLEAPLCLLTGTPPAEIAASPRIGISVGRELLLRFYEAGNSHISLPPRH